MKMHSHRNYIESTDNARKGGTGAPVALKDADRKGSARGSAARKSGTLRGRAEKTTALVLAATMLSANLGSTAAYAAAKGAEVDEKLYINMDYYGDAEKANVVKEIQFTTSDRHTDHGAYSEIINMTDSQDPHMEGDAVTWERPSNGSKLYFQGKLDPEAVELPWDFDVNYKLNGIVTSPDRLGGASGTVEIDIDAIPNQNVSEYMQNNIILMVLIPMDTSDVYSIDAPGSMEASFGNYSGIAFEALPGKEGHFAARFGTDSFESMGVMMIMTPVTVSDLDKVKDLKEVKDKFRDNTNAVMDSVEAIMDNVADMSSQLEKTNQVLDELANGKRKVDATRTIIFNGVDVSLQDVRELNALLDPLDSSLKTTQWMVYDLNNNLNATNSALVNTGAVMSTLSRKLRVLSEEMASTNTFSIDSVSADLDMTKSALKNLKTNLVVSGASVQNIKTITESDAFEDSAEEIIYTAGLDLSEYGEDYLPEAVIQVINASISDKASITKAELQAMIPTIAQLIDIYQVLATPKGQVASPTEWDTNDVAVSAAELSSIVAAIAVYQQTRDPSALMAAITGFLSENGLDPNTYAAGLITRLSAAANPSAEAQARASRFVGRVASMLDLKDSIDTLSNDTTMSAAGSSLKSSLQSLSDAGSEALANAITAYASVDYDTLINDIDGVMADIDDVMDAGASVSYQTSRLLDSTRKVTASVDNLQSTMNNYYEDIQTALTNSSNLIEQSEKLMANLTDTAQVLNNTLRSASEDFSQAGDDSIALGREAVENGNKIIDNTKKMKEAGADLRKAINDELDEEEADNNFLNMDPDAKKESLTSPKNQEPKMIQIICRTEEIFADDNKETVMDAEIEPQATTLTGRIAAIFKTMWSKVMGIFGH